MKKCAVIGSSGFIGYELVCQLMEYNDVTAVITGKGNESDVISEEKIFSIGRNSKVVFVEEEQFISENEHYDIVFICHFFDDVKLNEASIQLEQFEAEYKVISTKAKEIIFLLPATKSLSALERKANERSSECKVTFIEIPSLYGPWEPSSGLVHEIIVSELGKKSELIKNDYGSNEILYVEDVGKAIRLISEKELKEHKYVITAKHSMFLPEKSNFKGMQEMLDGIVISQMRKQMDATPFVILKTTSLDDGIQKQKQQIQQYFHLY